jgi:hypothetical protein
MTDISAAYLQDLGYLLRERLAEAERDAQIPDGPNKQFEAGRYRAYREVIALMLSQAEAFELTPSALSLEGIDRGTDLGC